MPYSARETVELIRLRRKKALADYPAFVEEYYRTLPSADLLRFAGADWELDYLIGHVMDREEIDRLAADAVERFRSLREGTQTDGVLQAIIADLLTYVVKKSTT